MKAAVTDGKGNLSVREVPEPEMGEYGVRCEILYGSLCTATDQHLINGDLPYSSWVHYPIILGHESIGRVIEMGAKVRNFAVGDLVTRVSTPPVGDLGIGWGGFAEQGIALDWQAMKADDLSKETWQGSRVNQLLPAEIDPAHACMVITWRETFSQLKNTGFKEGDSIAVIGSGGNGLAFAAHARNRGAAHLLLIGSAKREKEVEEVGAELFLDYKEGDLSEKALAVYPDGFDLVIDAVGSQTNMDLGLSLLKSGSRMLTYGLDDIAELTVDKTLAKGEVEILSPEYDEGSVHDEVVSYFQSGQLDASIWINKSQAFPLDQINDAVAAAAERRLVKPLIRICG